MRASIYLRTGLIVEVDLESITKVKRPVSGELAGFKWENAPQDPDLNLSELFYLNVNQVDAVVLRETDARPPVKM